jgi:NADPH:quinone reductase-like Zn-dependent oxidoreductase
MNHMDLWVRRGGPHFKLTYPHRLGCDLAGEVAALGPGARGVSVGDRVMLQPGLSCGVCAACLAGRDHLCRSYRILGENAQGGYARHVVVPDVNVLKIGPKLGFIEAAALPLCSMTASQMVTRKAEARAGQTVVIHAAGSGVSVMAIQLAKLAGARVVATTTDPEKAPKALALGADHVIVTSRDDYVAEVKRLTGKAGADAILDHVGGDLFAKALLAVAWGGRIVTCGATAGFQASLDLRHVFFRQVEILGSTMASKGDLSALVPLFEDGRVKPVIDRVVPLWDARAAHEALEGRQVFGKVVLEVSD